MTFIFQAIVIVVLLINLYNAFVILQTLEGSGFKQVKITEKSFLNEKGVYCDKKFIQKNRNWLVIWMLREMRLGDAEALREINAEQLGYDVPLTVTVRQMKKLLKEPEKIFSWFMKILFLKKQLAMYKRSPMNRFSAIRCSILWHLLCLNMLKKRNRKGLDDWRRRRSEKRGISAIRLNSAEYRVEAHRFYEHIGFHSDKMQKDF